MTEKKTKTAVKGVEEGTTVATESPAPSYHVAVAISVLGETKFRDIQANFGCRIDGKTFQAVRQAIAGQVGVAPALVTIINFQIIGDGDK